MRKADYAILANIIRRHRESIHHSHVYSQEVREMLIDRLALIADCFARESSVDRAKFLEACGIK
jgi:hypothetical protein